MKHQPLVTYETKSGQKFIEMEYAYTDGLIENILSRALKRGFFIINQTTSEAFEMEMIAFDEMKRISVREPMESKK